jgi:hypothetical protein
VGKSLFISRLGCRAIPELIGVLAVCTAFDAQIPKEESC